MPDQPLHDARYGLEILQRFFEQLVGSQSSASLSAEIVLPASPG